MIAGSWVFVCGPSGAGKDSVLEWSRARLAHEPRIVFARRLVTRAAKPDGLDDETSRQRLRELREGCRLAWHWEANGHAYGIDASYAADVASARIVVVNGSREHATAIADAACRRVVVSAPPELLARRLVARGRESSPAVQLRITRNGGLPPFDAELVIENSGELAEAGQRLQRYLESLAAG